MPNNSSKSHNTNTAATTGKKNAIMASDLGINMKNMYKQLAAASGGLTENKNYLNSHIS